MFKYELEIDTHEMMVKIVPFIEQVADPNVGITFFDIRKISYKDSFGRILFFNIRSFPDYLKCEDFPWERLKNLNEIINFVTMYDQYSEWTKQTQQPVWIPFVQPVDISWYTSSTKIIPFEDPFEKGIWGESPYEFKVTSPPSLGRMLSCSCLCSLDR